MSEARITTLSDFLTHSGLAYQVFDLGRRVAPLSKELFHSIEQVEQPYPYPFQNAAFLAVVFWHPHRTDSQSVWFLQLPLDEQGLILQSARDEFLVMLLERVGESMLAQADGKKLDGAFKDSPYTFKPRDDKMAAFNAVSRYQLNLPASQFHANAVAYFTGELPLEDWPTLAMQGVADFAVRMSAEQAKQLAPRFVDLPETPLNVLSQSLEHVRPQSELVESIVLVLDGEMAQSSPDQSLVIACLRALSNSDDDVLLNKVAAQVLTHPVSRNIEILAVFSGRMWPVLKQPEIIQQFTERLAENDAGQVGFSYLLADLMFIPGYREPVLQALRNPARSEKLSQAVGEMFSAD